MPSAEIITIGTEILLGEILDTNARYIAQKLRGLGVDLFRKSSVGDNIQRIAQEIQQALQRCDIVLTTGGLGPTVDDPTRQAVATALGTEIEFHPELWEQVLDRYNRYGLKPTENNKRQAFLPKGAKAIENPVGTAPAFLVEVHDKIIICLPGVPREMEYLFDQAVTAILTSKYMLKGIIKTRLLHTVGVGESRIDNLIGDLEALSNPSVGLAAHSGQVDIRITVKAASEQEADMLILRVETELRKRIGEWIYGVDEETLEGKIFEQLHFQGWKLSTVESGLNGALTQRLSNQNLERHSDHMGVYVGGSEIKDSPSILDLEILVDEDTKKRRSDCCLGVALHAGEFIQKIDFALTTPLGKKTKCITYGGPREYGPRYAIHNGLALLLNSISIMSDEPNT